MKRGLVWFRRDLRLHDHPALARSIVENEKTYIVFNFDPIILEPLKKKSTADTRVQFISESLFELSNSLRQFNSDIVIRYGKPLDCILDVIKEFKIDTLYFNRDYSPYALERDYNITQATETLGCRVQTFQDHVIYEPDEILNKSNEPYKVFTPYSKAWRYSLDLKRSSFSVFDVTLEGIQNGINSSFNSVNSILEIAGFDSLNSNFKGGLLEGKKRLDEFQQKIDSYHLDRDLPAVDGTSQLSVYIRHGCLSIRDLLFMVLDDASEGRSVWLNELIWREFYQMVLFNFPHVRDGVFNLKYQNLTFPGSEDHYQAWKNGITGYPIVDAAMRCFKETGWMHNRLRMIVASFLCKTLLVDWKRGERYFAWKLIDYELDSKNGGWQWASGTGCDAAPYFRIFNPYTQAKRFDPESKFIQKWCPEIGTKDYPDPIVDYKVMRQRVLDLYKSV